VAQVAARGQMQEIKKAAAVVVLVDSVPQQV